MSDNSKLWYKAPKTQVHLRLGPYIQKLMEQNDGHFRELLKFYRLYYGVNITNFQHSNYYRAIAKREGSSRNLISSIVDTIVNTIAGRAEPGVQFYTIGGTFKEERQAIKLNKFLQGIFFQTNAYKRGPEVLRDARTVGIWRTAYSRIKP